MRLIPVPLTDKDIKDAAPDWLPFLPAIARRSKETVPALFAQIVNKQVRLVLIWDDGTSKATALLGVRVHMRGEDRIGELIWAAGYDRKAWMHLLPDLEELLRAAGCVECRPLCRPGWAKMLKAAGYRLTHVQMEKSLAE